MTAIKVLAVLGIAACNPGPTYHRPAAPTPIAAHYKESAGWKLGTPSDAMLRGAWWSVFHEPELDALEARLELDNQTIKQAFENFLAARAQIRAARAQYFPTATTSPAITTGTSRSIRGATSDLAQSVTATGGRVTNYVVPVDVWWAPDLFGRTKNAVRQAQYGAQISAADLESQRLLEQATLAQTYFQIRGQDALIELLGRVVESDAKILAITRSLYETGIGTEVAVAQAEQTLEAARVQATNAGILRAQYEHAIATLLGVVATDFTIPQRSLLATPPAIPIGTPSHLLERRPDIAAAERRMAQANATLGIGYAAYFPTVTLTGSAGFASSVLGTLFASPSRFWSIGAMISQTLFDAGLRRAQIDQSIAAYNANVAGYRQTVLVAFQQVEDALAGTRILAQEVAQQRHVVTLAQRAFDLEKVRYETGIDPYIDLMTQQTTLLAAQQALVGLQVQEMTAAVMLVEALGGGWEVSQLPTPAEVSRPSQAQRQER